MICLDESCEKGIVLKVEVLAVVAIDVLQASMREKKKKNWDLVNPRISALIPYQDLDFEKSDCIKCVE